MWYIFAALSATLVMSGLSVGLPEPPFWELGSGNSALQVNSRGWWGAESWSIHPGNGYDLFQGSPSQFFFRIGTNDNETAFDPEQVVSAVPSPEGDRLVLRYELAGVFGLTLDYHLKGGGGVYRRSDLLTAVTVTNLSGGPVDLHLFMQCIFYLRNTGNDVVRILPNGSGFQTDDLVYGMAQSRETPDHLQANTGTVEEHIRFEDLGPNVLTGDLGPYGPGFVSFGYQWDMMLAVGESRTIHIFQHVGVLGSIANMNFDGDRRSDLNVYVPESGNWAVVRSWDDLYLDGGPQNWGWKDALPVPGDYDGDGSTDLAVYHPALGHWYIRKSSDGNILNGGPIQFGWDKAIPVPGDYDGDGKTDLAVYYPGAGQWYIAETTAGLKTPQWGWDKSIPVPGDYDGDGVTDIAVYYPAGGFWYILQSTDGIRIEQWGWSEAEPVPLDYDGDGKTDLAVYHPAAGNWYILKSSTGLLRQRQWGWSEAVPVAGDFDGGGKSDLAVYYPATGMWYIRSTETGAPEEHQWGWSDALPTDNQLRINRAFGFK